MQITIKKVRSNKNNIKVRRVRKGELNFDFLCPGWNSFIVLEKPYVEPPEGFRV